MKVFVYGTLRKGEKNAYLLQNALCLEKRCWTYGTLYDTGDGYPAMVESATSQIIGELYEVTKEELNLLDELEDYKEGRDNNLYERIIKEIYTDRGPLHAYMYIANRNKLLVKEILGGDWKEYRLSLKK